MATPSLPTGLRPPAHNAVVVRSVLEVTPEDREQILKDVEYNIFAFPAGLLTCDFLSDSGTSAMMDVQWAARKYIYLVDHSSVLQLSALLLEDCILRRTPQ